MRHARAHPPYRGHARTSGPSRRERKAAGLHTNALVAGGASLFVLLSPYGFLSATSEVNYDGSRVAAQIVSGIGYLGAGVIMLLLRPLGRRLDREPRGAAEVATDYHFEAVCPEAEEAHIRHRLVDAPGRPGYQLRSIRSQDGPVPGRVTVSALLTAEGEAGRALEETVGNLSLDPSVSAVGWAVVPARGGARNELNTFSPAGSMDPGRRRPGRRVRPSRHEGGSSVHQKRSYGRVLLVSTLVGNLEVALAVVVVLLYVRTQPPRDEPPDYASITGALFSAWPLVAVIAFLLSLVLVLPAVALSDLVGRLLGGRAAWFLAPLMVAALLAPLVFGVAAYNDAQTRPTLVFWVSATASLSLGALIALPRREGLTGRVARWGTAVVAGTGLLGALGLTVGLLPAYEPPAIGPQTMPGTWVDRTSGTLVFTPDGRVTASGVGLHRPGDRPGDPSQRCSGSGTWSYEPGRDVRSQEVRVQVPGCHWPAWGVGGTDREPRIHQKVGDPGSGMLYRLRKASGGP
ncbi:MgtC/SapB family protein [Streptomyces sp. NPDC048257]|uniref:MgtC/SapB family protein n=1 Tax=Streptomyces sp. NPDC048257 TaxID=3365526 RepID=UPI0037116E96